MKRYSKTAAMDADRDAASITDRFRQQLEDRLEGFGLKLAAEKTQCIEFGRFARANAYKRGEKPKGFTFLGFTHYCGKTREGYFKVKRRTSRKKLGESLRRFTEWARRAHSVLRKGEMLRLARARVVGHLSYYAITDNTDRCRYFVHRAERILFKWLNPQEPAAVIHLGPIRSNPGLGGPPRTIVSEGILASRLPSTSPLTLFSCHSGSESTVVRFTCRTL